MGIAAIGTVFFSVSGLDDAAHADHYAHALVIAAICSGALAALGAVLATRLVTLPGASR